MQPQDIDGGGVQGDGALAALALGLAGLDEGSELKNLPADRQRGLPQVDLGPAQADGLTASQAAEGDQVQ